MSSPYTTLVGQPPSPLTLAFRAWFFQLLEHRMDQVGLTRASRYYFDHVDGNDSTGKGTIALPWKTIAKAQAVHDDPGDSSDPLITHGGSNFALLFKRGVEWQEPTGLSITKSSVTVGAYGTGARPWFNRFTVQYAASGGAWTLVSGTHYKLSNTSNIAWVRDRARLLESPTRVTSSAEVDADDFSFWYDPTGDELHVNFGEDPDNLNIEAVIENDASGVIFTGDSCVVRDILFDGWGIRLTGNTTNQATGVKFMVSGTNHALAYRCGSYYGSTHSMETYATVAGGFNTFVECDMGYSVRNSTPASGEKIFATYNFAGGHECIMYECNFRRGTLPSIGYSNPRGGGIYSHTNGGAVRSSLMLFWGNKFEDHEHMVGDPGSCADVPTAATLNDVRAFFVDEVMETTRQTGFAFFILGTARINSKIKMAVTQASSVGAMAQAVPDAWIVNGTIRLDLSLITSGASGERWQAFYNSTSTDNKPRLYFSHIEVVGSGVQEFRIDRDMYFVSNNTSPNGEMIGCIYSGYNVGLFHVGLNNLAAKQHHNAYYGATDYTDNARGHNRDPYKVLPLDMPVLGSSPAPETELWKVGDRSIGLEYDANWNPRNKFEPCIGPIESSRYYYVRNLRFLMTKMGFSPLIQVQA